MNTSDRSFLAIDVGSSRVKLGWFPGGGSCSSPPLPGSLPIATSQPPQPEKTFAFWHRGVPEMEVRRQIAEWLESLPDAGPLAVLASVHADAAELVARIWSELGLDPPVILQASDLQLQLALAPPQFAGIDRLVNAVAVNRLRAPDRSAIVIDLGSACTVDLVDKNGVFQGGAILPGLSMGGSSLRSGTFSLPEVRPDSLDLPAHGIGKCTVEAISSGIYWSAVGGIVLLVGEYRQVFDPDPQIYLTGGDAPVVLDELQNRCGEVRLVPHLLLSGIGQAYGQMTKS